MNKQLLDNASKISYTTFWILLGLTVVLFETDILPQGLWSGSGRIEFIALYMAFLLMLLIVPFTLWKYSQWTKKLLKTTSMNSDGLQSSLRRYGFIRLILLFIPTWFNIIVYYLTMNTSALLCAAIGIIAAFFCLPERVNHNINK